MVRLAWQIVRSALREVGRLFARGFVGAVAALVAVEVSDNIESFTKSSYSNPVLVVLFVAIVLVAFFSRNKRWGVVFRKTGLLAVSWIFGVIAYILIAYAEKDVSFFNGSGLSAYNALVAVALLYLLVLPTPIFGLSDFFRDIDDRISTLLKFKSASLDPQFL